MRVLLTGGAGFIGSAVARALRGHEVMVLDKLTYAGKRENLHGVDVELVVGDVCDGPLVSRLMQGRDVVIHAAAESHVTNSLEDAAPFLRTNIDGTRNMLEAAARARVPHFIHVSIENNPGAFSLSLDDHTAEPIVLDTPMPTDFPVNDFADFPLSTGWATRKSKIFEQGKGRLGHGETSQSDQKG